MVKGSISKRKEVRIYIGKDCGRWVVIAPGDDYYDKSGLRHRWICRCVCGTIRAVIERSLVDGMSQSCGCAALEANQTHAKTNTVEFRCWIQARDRCFNSKSASYDDYGGRGIVVCQGWDLFENFYRDMGQRPEGDYSIERRNNGGGYWCGECDECIANNWTANCYWATRFEQCRNRRNNQFLTYDNRTQCVTDWAVEKNMAYSTLFNRLYRGWSVEDALTIPVRSKAVA